VSQKLYRFWYHYNKPASLKRGRSVLTVHWKNKCILVDNIKCEVPTESHERKSQPRCIIRGYATDVVVIDDIAYIKK
jgi:hypothetical protein